MASMNENNQNLDPNNSKLNPLSDNSVPRSKDEKDVLGFWKDNRIFEKSVNQREGSKPFVFFEGPPYANGRPGIHHAETRVFKDLVLRYKTMRGFYVSRRAGWDTHGLPTEMEVEKILGIKSKKEIEEKVGVEKFTDEARKNVFLYKEEWEKFTERIGYWLDLEHPYVTMENYYIESIWWIISEISKKGLLYEDYKVLPWCPRCETVLSTHELAQGYKTTKDKTIYVKFPVKGEENSYFLVWTTTPWTLPANVSLAVNPDIEYAKIKFTHEIKEGGEIKDGKEEIFILANERLEDVLKGKGKYEIIEKFEGSRLIGSEYEPLYPSSAPYKTIGGDFVSAQDGSGIVHIAPAFGEDDMRVGKENRLPVLTTVNSEGKMTTEGYLWNGLFIKDADPLIIKDLNSRGLLFRSETYEHEYPHCWRCQSPLIYYAKTSWWLKTTAVKDKMIAENSKINWLPAHIKEGRFGEWLANNRDWAISRERYWGTPLPVWKCEKCKQVEVIGSIAELKGKTKKSGNKYFVMRHGEAESNGKNKINASIENSAKYPLTEIGKGQVSATAEKLRNEKIDLIICSDFFRTEQTALLVSEKLGLKKEDILRDERLREVKVGIFEERNPEEYHNYFDKTEEKFFKSPEGGENLNDLKKRVGEFLYDIENKVKGKNILIVSHAYPIWMLFSAAAGLSEKEAVAIKGDKDFFETAEMRQLEFCPLSRNNNFVLDLHKPYIDGVVVECSKCGGEAKKVPEVMDVWLDSGAMPFAQLHYPFENKNLIDDGQRYPADFICEGLDQTRGWFYTMFALATLLGYGSPYKNVMVMGLVLDTKGQKMSKSRGNIVAPADLVDKYGADAARWYFYTVNQPWDDKMFDEKDVGQALRRFVMIFWNSVVFWKTYGGQKSKVKIKNANLIVNKWILVKLDKLIHDVTSLLDKYDIAAAAREIENFAVEDVSHWYIRRIRDAMKDQESEEAREVSNVFGLVLLELSKIMAPFIPFMAERAYSELGGDRQSVHFEDWPVAEEPEEENDGLLKQMGEVRKVVSLALEERARLGIKVRQPLKELRIKNKELKGEEKAELFKLVKDEVNVKEVVFDDKIEGEVEFDTEITKELKDEGELREFSRSLQDLRKRSGLKPGQKASLRIQAEEQAREFIEKFENEIKKAAGLDKIEFNGSLEEGQEVKTDRFIVKVKIEV